MQIVIDISDSAYETLKIFGKGNVGYYHEVILNGTPLPKGHGKLYDEMKY